jgi:hypothetical protein
MGSGSFGGGGGGGGGGRGGGGTGGPGGPVRFRKGNAVPKAISSGSVFKQVKATLRSLKTRSSAYLIKQFCSPIVASVYEQLFEISVHLFINKSWAGIHKRYGVDPSNGCMKRLAKAIVDEFQAQEPDERVRETVLMGLEDFFVKAANNDLSIWRANGEQVIQKLDQDVFKSTSAFFLTFLLWRVLQREQEALPREMQTQLRSTSESIANGVVRSFEEIFQGKLEGSRQITHRALFRIIGKNQDWFFKELLA